MRPPSSATWFIGNSVVSLILMIGGVAVVGMWLMGLASGWAAFWAAMAASLAARANEKVRARAAWEREWNGGRRGFTLPRGGRIVLGLAAWIWLAWLSLQPSEGDATMELASGLFWLASLLMVIMGIVRLVKRHARRGRGKPVVVTVCLARPMRSPSVQQAYAQLQEQPN